MNSNEMTEESPHRARLLAPLVVIMLCAVALTGAAYAYSTSVQVNGNQVNAEYYSIDVYNGSHQVITDNFTLSNPIELNSNKVGDTITVSATTQNNITLGYVRLFLDSTTPNKTIASSAIVVGVTTSPASSTAGNTATVALANAGGAVVTLTFALGDADVNGDRAITMSVSMSNASFTATSSFGAADATDAVNDAIEALTYSLSFTYASA